MSYEFGMREPLLCTTRVVECGRGLSKLMDKPTEYSLAKRPMTPNWM